MQPSPVTVFYPDADAKVRLGSGNNYGDRDDMRLRANDWESYIKFVVSEIVGAPQSATLRLYVQDGSPDGGTLHLVSDDSWTELGINGDNAPAMGTALGSGLSLT